MRLSNPLRSNLPLGLLLWAGTVFSLPALTVTDLQQQMTGPHPVTVIDLRAPFLFARGHIVGAINVPASVCPHKNLPPLGKVVVYDGGLGKEDSEAAAVVLSAKPGISVEVLEGGFAAWETARAQTTQAKGIRRETQNQISYAELKALKASDVVLVDLRSEPSAPKAVAKTTPSGSQPLTDLAVEFPGKSISHSPFDLPAAQMKTKAATSTPPLLVLIDNGDGVAQTMARTLEANGLKRYVILTGGELILSRQGQAGLQRSSPASQAANRTVSSGPATQK